MRHPDDFHRAVRQIGKAFAAFDPRNADIGAQIQVCRQLPLRDRDFKWPAACYCWNIVPPGGGDLTARGIFFSNQPARHRDFEDRD